MPLVRLITLFLHLRQSQSIDVKHYDTERGRNPWEQKLRLGKISKQTNGRNCRQRCENQTSPKCLQHPRVDSLLIINFQNNFVYIRSLFHLFVPRKLPPNLHVRECSYAWKCSQFLLAEESSRSRDALPRSVKDSPPKRFFCRQFSSFASI